MKGNVEHTIPVTAALQHELKDFSRPKDLSDRRAKFRKALPEIPNWRPHDFRRYMSSTCAMLGVDITTTEAILAHKTGGSRSAMQRVYDRYDRWEPMKNALLRFEEQLVSFVERTRLGDTR